MQTIRTMKIHLKHLLFLAVSGMSAFSYSQDTWTQKATLPGEARALAVGQGTSTLGFIGTGSGSASLMDFWEYISYLFHGFRIWFRASRMDATIRVSSGVL